MPAIPIASPSAPVSVAQGFNKIKVLAHRTPADSANGDGFLSLVDYRDGGIFLAHYAGNSEWERHPKGDEMVMIMEGETTLILLHNGQEIRNPMSQGMLLVVPQNIWHRFESPQLVKIMTITPQPTDHSVERPA
jgi:mannose-6-phosphate isomerase-like protein (cupin superfamily)|tara:strand:+ start:1342 stop:1743 length:402 start_codon:yes stop_codon:yes gene_type:complete